jgi:nucleoside-diphosphate-sugar epimerase
MLARRHFPLAGLAFGICSAAGPHSCSADDRKLADLERRLNKLEQHVAGGSKSMLIVGCGKLGSLAGTAWLANNRGATVTALTRTNKRHVELVELGFEATITAAERKWPYVLFTAPPRSNPDYSNEVRKAAALWDGSGTLLFTSSGSVFAESKGGVCTESSAVASTPRAKKLLDAEKEALEAGGCVVRLAGLYDVAAGPHAYWLRTLKVNGHPDGLINLIHYEDAADLCVLALGSGLRRQLFLGNDGVPVSRRSIVESALSAEPAATERPVFAATEGPLGKIYDNTYTRGALQWAPRFSSFPAFMVQQPRVANF